VNDPFAARPSNGPDDERASAIVIGSTGRVSGRSEFDLLSMGQSLANRGIMATPERGHHKERNHQPLHCLLLLDRGASSISTRPLTNALM